MGCIDVLYHCGLELDLHTFKEERIEQPKRLQEDEIECTVTSRVKKESTYEGVETLQNMQMSRKTTPVHGFRGLLVTANALLIAVTDKHGSVYVISTDEYFAGFQSLHGKSSPLSECFNCSDLNILSSWEVAGSDIGGQKPNPDIPNRHWFKSFADEKGWWQYWRKDFSPKRRALQRNEWVPNLPIFSYQIFARTCPRHNVVSA